MACSCSHEPAPPKSNSKFRTALWIALLINLTLFGVELIGGAYAHSSALWADALDFFWRCCELWYFSGGDWCKSVLACNSCSD